MKAFLFLILISVFSVILSGCATPYQPTGLRGGYSDVRLSKDIYKVSFRGNGYTGLERVEDFLLYRCAELTIKSRYKYFMILSGNINPGQTYNVQKYKDGVVIKMLRSNKGVPAALNAKIVMKSLKGDVGK